MIIALQESVRATTDELATLLTGLGFGAERLDMTQELAIDQFDQWTNPRGAVLACTCPAVWPGAATDVDHEFVRAA